MTIINITGEKVDDVKRIDTATAVFIAFISGSFISAIIVAAVMSGGVR